MADCLHPDNPSVINRGVYQPRGSNQRRNFQAATAAEETQRIEINMNNNNTGGTFIHREIYNFLPQKVEPFHARLLTDPIMQQARSMPGCSSFNFYRRTSPPVADRGGDNRDAARALEESESPFFVSEETGAKTEETGAKTEELQVESLSDGAKHCKASTGKVFLSVEAVQRQEDTNFSVNTSLVPHQFMAIGTWQDKASYEGFFFAKHIQKFFCSIMSHKIFKSFPVLTMWSKRNGQHTRSDNAPQTLEQETTAKGYRQFVMTRKRWLRDVSTAEREGEDTDYVHPALRILKELSSLTLLEEGCIRYDVSVTGHKNFNNQEILEIGVWSSPEAFVHHSNHVYDMEFQLCSMFDATKDEHLFWETPQPQEIEAIKNATSAS